MKGITLPMLALALAGCTSQFSLGPAAWSAAPVIPGFHAVGLPGGGFIEQPDLPPAPPAPAETPEQTVLQALEEAQRTRTAIRQLAR